MQKCLIPTESCFLDGKKKNLTKLVDINFLADNEKNRQAIRLSKNGRVNGFFLQILRKCAYLCIFACRIHFCTEN